MKRLFCVVLLMSMLLSACGSDSGAGIAGVIGNKYIDGVKESLFDSKTLGEVFETSKMFKPGTSRWDINEMTVIASADFADGSGRAYFNFPYSKSNNGEWFWRNGPCVSIALDGSREDGTARTCETFLNQVKVQAINQ